ncbi:MAG: putative virulence factor, partial [Muribaculaceae bacterium]|nr:putative virulence factor [Muribaculaceae bacterium]
RKLADTVRKELLADTDLLDFPGARSAEQQDESFCTEGKRDKNGQSVLVKLFLRGKIAYLFNHYSESHMMKVLMFCHHHKQSEVKNLHILLDQWVRRNVGSTPDERAATLARTGGVSPLLLVATKINLDMTLKNHESLNSEAAVANRWEDRFRTVLLDAVLNWSNMEWFRNWSAPGVSFKDTYMLRSFEYCSCTPAGNQMFRGYDVSSCTPEESLEMPEEYYRLLRRTFVGSPAVRELFYDPELSWDVVATLNNDGSLYIIERMTKAAKAAAEIRSEQMRRERDGILQGVKELLLKEFDPEDESEKLESNILTAGNIRWEFDACCTDDSYFFGHLLQALQV